VEDLQARLEKLLTDAEDCALIGKLATDVNKCASSIDWPLTCAVWHSMFQP
jgi:hypothetical protein